MTTLFWVCLLGGLGLALFLAIFGDVLDVDAEADLDFDADADLDAGSDGVGQYLLDPLSWVAGASVFGGAGIVLTETTALTGGALLGVAALIGLALAITMHFAYVRPMKNSENSTAFSVREYVGKMGEVGVSIPAEGYGEVQVRMGVSTTFQPATSFEGVDLPRGTTVVVVEVEPDGTLRVSRFEDEVGLALPASGPASARRLAAAS